MHINDFIVGPATSVTNWSPYIATAIAAADEGEVIHFDAMSYPIEDPIVLGTGSGSAYSDKNSIRLQGVGLPFFRQNGGSPLGDNGTRFVWTGEAGATVVTIAGPCVGNDISDIIIDGQNEAAVCLKLVSSSLGNFDRVAVTNFTECGVRLTTIDAVQIGGQTEMLTTAENRFGTLWMNGAEEEANVVTCLDLDAHEDGAGVTRNHFDAVYSLIRRNGSTGRRFGFADQNSFQSYVNTCVGMAEEIEDLPLTTTATRLYAVTAFGGVFPQHNVDDGHYDSGQDCQDVIVEGAGIQGGHYGGLGTALDLQQQLTLDAAKVYRRSYSARGAYPNGGFLTESGLLIADRPFRNAILNGFFEVLSGGRSFVNPGSGAPLADGFSLGYDGTAAVTATVVDIAPGENDFPRQVRCRRYLELAFTGGTSTFRFLRARVPDARTYRGSITALSVWGRLSSGASAELTSRIERRFGTGGAPSAADAVADMTLKGLTGAWSRPVWHLQMNDDAGKTYGTAEDDYIDVLIGLPTSGTFTIQLAMPQWEVGCDATLPEYRHPKLEEILVG